MNSKDHDPKIPEKVSAQPKTTLKWSSNGELSAIDMARILERLSDPELTQCDVACDLENQKNSCQESLPSTAWLP